MLTWSEYIGRKRPRRGRRSNVGISQSYSYRMPRYAPEDAQVVQLTAAEVRRYNDPGSRGQEYRSLVLASARSLYPRGWIYVVRPSGTVLDWFQD